MGGGVKYQSLSIRLGVRTTFQGVLVVLVGYRR
jgi:hypothetical protein